MKLAKSIVRINGYIKGKRTGWGKGDVIPIYFTEDMEQEAFRRGLDTVTSINAYNYVGDHRITERLW